MGFQQSLLNSLSEKGWVYSDQILSESDFKRLQDFAKSRLAANLFRPAQTAAGLKTHIRSDSLLWLDSQNTEESWIFEILEAWRNHLTQELMVAAPKIEAHMTHYSPGQSYKIHCDQPYGSDSRVLTYVVYLHENWQPEYGGELAIYSGPEGEETHRIEPRPGRVVFFKSREIWHQVRETQFHRISLTGWFRHS